MKSSFTTFWPWLAAALSGVLLALCYPPFDAGGFVWIWQGPLLTALWFAKPETARWKHGMQLGFVSGFAFFLISISWLTEVSRVAGTVWAGIGALLSLSFYLAFYFAAFGAFAATAGRWIIRKPDKSKKDLFGQSIDVLKVAFLNGAAWCGLEWLRGILFTGFGWNGLGVALKDQLLLVQFADVIGITGYGFVLMFAGIITYATLVRLVLEVKERKRLRPHLDFALGVAMIIGLFLYGIPKVSVAPKESINIQARIMQLNIPLEDKWSEDIKLRQKIIFDYRDLTRTFTELAPHDLVLWPETAIPGHFSFPWVQKYFNDHVLKGDDFYLLTGLEDSTLQGDKVFNTITLMQGSTETYQMHRKIHLVPLGEYIPFRNSFPLLKWIAGSIIETDFTPGDSYEPLEIEKEGQRIEILPLICFEDTVPRHARKFIGEGPQIFVNVTNDGWFYESAQPTQHFYNAIFRCIEFRRPMIRAANTGVSGFIDTRGSTFDRHGHTDDFPRIIQDEVSGSTYIRGSLPGRVEVDLNPPITLYARFGDTFSIALGIVALGFALLSFLRSRKQMTTL
ncbi:MAG: apolipoprotein N-acyltransferase [Verrucomicrobiales bacterium]|nr:apolipoprotein N-acyltransferase [Verrucomicrobiales bacterium]